MTHKPYTSGKSVLMHITIYGLLTAFMVTIFFGCEQVQQFLTPGGPSAIKIGLIYTAPSRNSSRYGAELAAIEINQQGGIAGIPIELVIKDNGDDVERSAKLAEQLITQDGVAAIVGPNFSRHSVKVAPIAQSHGVPMISTTATSPSVTAFGDFVFLAAFSDDFQGQVMAQFAIDELNAQTAAILTETEDVYSAGLSQTFLDNFTALGGRIVAAAIYAKGDTDFTDQLTTIAEFAPDVIFMPGFAPEVPIAIQQARTIPQPNATGITATFLGGDSWDVPPVISSGPAIEGSYFSSAFAPAGDSLNDSARQFAAAYTSVYGLPPNSAAALGYDALKLVVQAMRRAGSLSPEAVRDQIAATRGYRGATTIESYDENRHPIKSAVISQISGGQADFHRLIEP